MKLLYTDRRTISHADAWQLKNFSKIHPRAPHLLWNQTLYIWAICCRLHACKAQSDVNSGTGGHSRQGPGPLRLRAFLALRRNFIRAVLFAPVNNARRKPFKASFMIRMMLDVGSTKNIVTVLFKKKHWSMLKKTMSFIFCNSDFSDFYTFHWLYKEITCTILSMRNIISKMLTLT